MVDNKDLIKLLKEATKGNDGIISVNTQTEIEPNEYKVRADKIRGILNLTEKHSSLDSFTLSASLDYMVGDLFEQVFKDVRIIADKLIEAGHTSNDTELDYYCADQYAFAYKDDDNTFFIKREQNYDMVVIFDDKYGYQHIRRFYPSKLNEYYMDDLVELVNKIKASNEIDYRSINSLSGLIGMMSDEKIDDYPNRLSLESVLSGKATRYKDGRDTGYVLTTKKTTYDYSIEAEGGYDLNLLKQLSFTLNSNPFED